MLRSARRSAAQWTRHAHELCGHRPDAYVGNNAMQSAKVDAALSAWSAALRDAQVAMMQAGPGICMDIGCGDGANTLKLASALGSDWRLVGVDVSESMIAHCRRAHESGTLPAASAVHLAPFSWHCADVGDEGALARVLARCGSLGCADLVTSFNALHWLPEARHPAMLRNVRRVLNQEAGRALIEIEAAGSMDGMFSCIEEVARTHERWAPRFAGGALGSGWAARGFYRPSAAEYERMAHAAGFSRVRCTTVPHTSRHAGEAGVRSRLVGAWTQLPSLAAHLRDELEAREFLVDVATAFAAGAQQDEIPLTCELLLLDARP